jgi:hypothetical protein
MRRPWILVKRILVLGPDRRIHVKGRLIGKHELAIDDFHARTERRAARIGRLSLAGALVGAVAEFGWQQSPGPRSPLRQGCPLVKVVGKRSELPGAGYRGSPAMSVVWHVAAVR